MMTEKNPVKPSAADRARSARVRKRLADYAREFNINAGFALPKKRKAKKK